MSRDLSRRLASHATPLGLLLAVAACGGPKAAPMSPGDESTHPATTPGTPSKPREPEAYEPGASAADVVSPYVRPEHSSRLAVALPKGKAREKWTFALDPKLDPAFVLTAGSRIVVQGRPTGSPTARESPFVIVDTHGVRVTSDRLAGDHVRLDPAEGKLFGIGGTELPSAWKLADGSRSPDKLAEDDPRGVSGALAVRASSHAGTHVFITKTSVEVDARASGQQRTVVEPPIQPLDAAIDDDGNLHVIVRQDREIALWTTPLAGGSVGRIRLGTLRRDRADVPPILGKAVRVVVLDDRMLAVAQDGKTLWERRGALTGGATITSDDRLLCATDAKVLVVEPSGRATELVSAPKEIFLTPPILTGSGLLLVATGSALHAYAFE